MYQNVIHYVKRARNLYYHNPLLSDDRVSFISLTTIVSLIILKYVSYHPAFFWQFVQQNLFVTLVDNMTLKRLKVAIGNEN